MSEEGLQLFSDFASAKVLQLRSNSQAEATLTWFLEFTEYWSAQQDSLYTLFNLEY
jgi:hypothetical protein